MFESYSRAWELGKQSSQVLNRDPELLTYPFLAVISCVLTLVPFYMGAKSLLGPQSDPAMGYAAGFVALLAVISVCNFWDVALMCAARSRLLGGDPSFSTGIACASRRLGRVLLWSLLSSVMQVVTLAIRGENRRESWLSRLLQGAWEVVSYFALPVMVFEGASLTTALSRSREVAVRTWGTALTGYIGLRAITEMLVVPGVLIVLAVFFWLGPEAAQPAVFVLIPYCILVSLYVSALEQVYRVQVYLQSQQPGLEQPRFVNQTQYTEVMEGPMPSTRPTRMCPRCLDPLAAQLHGQVSVDACARCGGLWLDKGETDRLLAAGPLPAALSHPTASQSQAQYRGSGQRECPVCESLMAVSTVDGIQVDHCRQCGGAFFDRGELAQIKPG